ncbi:monosaccharide ABC transporter substrate-binding protein (CUT2 family) [Glaciihabitans tibetensis]|uniref:Monosaccharide ABC transporter substrate-binding protein (CUT2 family) n=1 Tax=Glaciihabitans tibetensis TaxID=1266600 RepID=A0A2T0V1K5_9MICO|nr:autoinducer 2 ABC transporter substrate-binding protein [Glaciihabitans tibetensis]PRY64065.1 monosaccharide ABC transporter substrate-binding protein (CUT2 family) [Glaciihabitans tibetensis]
MRAKRAMTVGAIALAATITVAGCTTRNDDSAGGSGGGEDDQITVAFVPKLQGIPYFEAMNAGGQAAAEELGIEWLYQGPTTADAAAQADIVRSFIQQDVDALIVAPNDPDSMAPLLKEAADKGIKVATSDTDAPNSVREVFVNQASAQGIGEALTDSLMNAMGGSGKYAIVSCGETAANLNAWIAVQEEYTASEYPDAEIVDIVYAGEDQAAATSMATDLMNANPDLTGLVGECTSSAPGVAQAVKDANKIGSVFTVGLGTPMSMAPYLEDGSSSASILWNVENLGYLTAWTGQQLAEGNEIAATNDVNSDMPAVEFDEGSKVLLLGPPLEITKDNVGDFDY